MINKILFIGFEKLNLKNSFRWSEYRLKFNPIDHKVIFLNLTGFDNKFQNDSIKVRDDLSAAINSGATVFVIFEPAIKKCKDLYKRDFEISNSRILPITNFDFGFTYDTGTSKNIIEAKYTRYFRHLKNWHWYYNVTTKISSWDQFKITSVANNNINEPIGFYIFLRKGQGTGGFLVILPKIDNIELGIKEFLEDFANIKIFEKEPIWLKEVRTLKEKDLIKIKNNTKEKIKIENSKIIKINSQLKEEKNTKKILYEDGAELEESVRFVFTKLGLGLTQNKISEEDCFIETKFGNFLFEIKGSESGFDKKGLRQLIDWEDDFEKKGYSINRCIFLGNHYRFKPFTEREYPFADNLVKYSVKLNFLLMTTTDLFNIYNLFLEKRINTKNICNLFKTSASKFNLNNLS